MILCSGCEDYFNLEVGISSNREGKQQLEGKKKRKKKSYLLMFIRNFSHIVSFMTVR